MSDFEVFLPGNPPGVNHYVCHTHDGRHYMTAKARAWLEAATDAARWAAKRQGWENPQTAGMFAVYIEHTAKRLDIDGPVKIILDAVARGVGFDDKRVSHLEVNRVTGDPPGVGVRIWIVEETT